jgi:DNA processing protein
LLDRVPAWRYLQRLGMTSLYGHNHGHNLAGEVPKTSDMTQAMSFATALDPHFPVGLRRLAKVPSGLWFRGRLPAASERGVAIVGSRAASRAGATRATEIAASLARAGFFVVSGGALGIDGAAHRGALEAGGVTFAVLGCGVDVLYPQRHTKLFEQMVIGGGILSEYPPGSPPRPGCFPVRNRIVSALADAVVVVEARPWSGALITARRAVELGQTVIAVPGSAGTDQLLASGLATAAQSGEEILRCMAGEAVPHRGAPAEMAPLLAALEDRSDSAVGIAQRLGVSLPAALGVLAEAELSGWVRRLAGGRYEVPHGVH